ncbi:hypothetical protein ACI3L1_06375 [Deinococcus sp. SM5_A1]|uniref:hypothetical protein n=1 Tax=Deinococcus sp. SM5_A1 TaxID=3379094 RepID=UPI003859B5EB
MSRFKTTRIKMIFCKTPLIVLAALPLTVGAVLAQQSGTAAADATVQAQQLQRVQPTQLGQRGAAGTQTRTRSGTNYGDVYLQKLAAQLGISLDKLKAAALAAGNATIDQGVKNGDLAANRAAAMKIRLKDQSFALLGGRGMGGPDGRGGRGMHGPGGRGGGPRGDLDIPDSMQGQTDIGTVDPNEVEGGS